MPLYKTIPISQGLIGIWRLSETTADLLPEFSETEISDPLFAKYTHGKRQLEWLTTRLLLKKMIGNELTISYMPSGKPLLLHKLFREISITHSRDFVAIIVHESKKIGIDIENTARDFKRIEKRFLSAEELEFTGDNTELKCLFWCAKEAVFKLVDDDGIEFREQIIVGPLPENENQFSVEFITGGKRINYQIAYDFFAENCLVWIME